MHIILHNMLKLKNVYSKSKMEHDIRRFRPLSQFILTLTTPIQH